VSPVTGRTAVYGIAGDPVAHSLTPALHEAAFAALRRDAVSVALRARADAAATVVDAVRRLGIRGLSVTMPLKSAVVAHCEERSDVVARLGAANCLTATAHGTVRADSTDGDGLLAAIACATGAPIDGARCAVLGAGGAARAAVEALSRGGAAEVVVVARRETAARQAAALAAVARAGTADEAARADVVVQATPVGMHDTAAATADALVAGARLGAGQVAVELVYHPRVTPWLRGATAGGAATVEGVEVLAHQAAVALERWLDAAVPIGALHAVMRAGADGTAA
jgi:shikimate dehydrogenase